MRLRDLLKFEFFFADKERFRQELADEISLHDDKWESALARGRTSIQAVVRSFRPFNAHRVLRPFLHGYLVVADALVREKTDVALDQNAFLDRCMRSPRGPQSHVQNATATSRPTCDTPAAPA